MSVARYFKLSIVTLLAVGYLLPKESAAVTTSASGGGTITFSGAVTKGTCNWEGDSPDFTVKLDPISRSELGTTVGLADAKKVAFDLVLYNACEFPYMTTMVDGGIYFTGSNVSDDRLYLKNDYGTARGVGIAITSDGATILPMNRISSTQDGTVHFDYDYTLAKGTIHFYAHYYNYGGENISTGSVITSVIYYMDYV